MHGLYIFKKFQSSIYFKYGNRNVNEIVMDTAWMWNDLELDMKWTLENTYTEILVINQGTISVIGHQIIYNSINNMLVLNI